jgi:hypothetical protein
MRLSPLFMAQKFIEKSKLSINEHRHSIGSMRHSFEKIEYLIKIKLSHKLSGYLY